MANRFDYVKYDDRSAERQANFKTAFQALEMMVDGLSEGRAKSLVMTKLEEAYMWVGKAIRDDQVYHRGAVLQEERNDDAD
jgi:hypothetical protein